MITDVDAHHRVRWFDLLILARPWYLPVAIAPFVGGRVLADPSAGPDAILTDATVWSGVLALVLTWIAVAIVNDAFDLPTDLRNPRRTATSELVQRWRRERLLRVAGLAAALALTIASAGAGLLFMVGVAAVLILGWAYSAPPVRLKERPGLDVLANAIPVGVLAPLAGWLSVAPPAGFPWQLGLLGTLTVAALYLPTTMIDERSDRAAGVRTTAVALGSATTYRVGVALWSAASIVCLASLITGVLLPVRLQWFDLIAWGVVVASYPVLIRRPSIRRLAIVSTTLVAHGLLLLVG
jgi:chlorophyll synthase